MNTNNLAPSSGKNSGLIIIILLGLLVAGFAIYLTSRSDNPASLPDTALTPETTEATNEDAARSATTLQNQSRAELEANYAAIDQMDENLNTVPVDGASEAF